MKNPLIRTVLVMVIMPMFCFMSIIDAMASLSSLSGLKFTERIERKQEMLHSIRQNDHDLSKADLASCDAAAEKYLTRLEEKMGTLVMDTLNEAGTPRPGAFNPVMPNTLIPESRFQDDSMCAEKENSRK